MNAPQTPNHVHNRVKISHSVTEGWTFQWFSLAFPGRRDSRGPGLISEFWCSKIPTILFKGSGRKPGTDLKSVEVLKRVITRCWDVSETKGVCCQAWWVEFQPGIWKVAGGTDAPQIVLWLSHVCPHQLHPKIDEGKRIQRYGDARQLNLEHRCSGHQLPGSKSVMAEFPEGHVRRIYIFNMFWWQVTWIFYNNETQI